MKLVHRRNRLSTSSTVMPTIVVSESASQAISSAVTAWPEDFCSGKHSAIFYHAIVTYGLTKPSSASPLPDGSWEIFSRYRSEDPSLDDK
jgi:hypothetical protein